MNSNINRTTKFIDLGLIDYQEALNYQTMLFESILAVKNSNRSLPADEQIATSNYLIFCQHPNVFTLGRNGDISNLKLSTDELAAVNASYYPVGRGGDITYHGPGQLVVYPVIDLENFFTDIHKYMRLLEESVIQTLVDFGINGVRIPGLTGVWCNPSGKSVPEQPKKICALGVKSSRWVMLHGLALNVNPDLSYFGFIVPCGIADKGVTSVEEQADKKVSIEECSRALKNKIGTLFEMSFEEMRSPEIIKK